MEDKVKQKAAKNVRTEKDLEKIPRAGERSGGEKEPASVEATADKEKTAEENTEKCKAFLDELDAKDIDNLSDEELLRYAREAQRLLDQKFSDDEEWINLEKQWDAETEKTPYITKEMEAIAEKMVATARGRLKPIKNYLELRLLNPKHDTDQKDEMAKLEEIAEEVKDKGKKMSRQWK